MSANFMPTLASGEPFRFWCQKVLPLVYDDSLSYYELLNKVVTYLNGVIDDVSKLGDAYQQLEDYVNHYFDTHDIEQIVNDKLDAMVKDGTLDRLIQPALDEKFEEYSHTIDSVIAGQNKNIENRLAAQDTKIASQTSTLNTRLSSQDTAIANQTSTLNTRLSAQDTKIAGMMVTIPALDATSIGGSNTFAVENLRKWVEYVSAHYAQAIVEKPVIGVYHAGDFLLILGFSNHFETLTSGMPNYAQFLIVRYGNHHLYELYVNKGTITLTELGT